MHHGHALPSRYASDAVISWIFLFAVLTVDYIKYNRNLRALGLEVWSPVGGWGLHWLRVKHRRNLRALVLEVWTPVSGRGMVRSFTC